MVTDASKSAKGGASTPKPTRPCSKADASLWAARLHCTSKGLRRATAQMANLPFDMVPPSAAAAADVDHIRDQANKRRAQVRRSLPDRLASAPGERLLLDGAPFTTAAVTDGHTYQMRAVCEATNFIFAQATTRHRVKEWVDFVLQCVAYGNKYGRCTKMVRFDRAPELVSKQMREALAPHKILVEEGGRGHHEAVGRMEVHQGIIMRHAEASLQRCERGMGHLPTASLYAITVLNMKSARGSDISRHQAFTGEPADAAKTTPYLYGADAYSLDDEQARGVAGSGRCRDGVFVGISPPPIADRSYLLLGDTGRTLHCRNITPMNEGALVKRGKPAGDTMVDEHPDRRAQHHRRAEVD